MARTRRLRRSLTLAALFVLFSLPTCLYLSAFVPTGEPPDEPAHILRADSLSYGQITGQRREVRDADGNTAVVAGFYANPALLQASHDYFPTSRKLVTDELVQRLRDVKWAESPVFIRVPNTAVYPPLFYVPAALSLDLAYRLGASPWTAIIIGRIVGSLCFVVIGAVALAIARHGHGILFVVLTLPMTLSLAASFNQDGLLVAVSALAAALLTRCTAPRGRSYWLGGAALACVIAAKVAYLPLAAAMLIPLCRSRRREDWRPVLAGSLLTALPGLLWTAFSMAYVAAPFEREPYHPGPLWPGDPDKVFHGTNTAAQLQVLLHDPSLIVLLPAHAWLPRMIWLRWMEMVGVLGPLDVLLPKRLYWLWLSALLLTALGDAVTHECRPRMQEGAGAIIGAVAGVLCLLAVYDAQYLWWTGVGAPAIEGLEGRYFLPLLAFVGLALPRVLPAPRRLPVGLTQAALILPATVAAAVGAVVLPLVVWRAYYLQP